MSWHEQDCDSSAVVLIVNTQHAHHAGRSRRPVHDPASSGFKALTDDERIAVFTSHQRRNNSSSLVYAVSL
jgi:hypothetical protein